jgi:hypothetical protein
MSGFCGVLLFKSYYRHRTALLFWAMLCFLGLALSNILLVIDLLFLPQVDLSLLRNCVTLASLSVMIYGFIWEIE